MNSTLGSVVPLAMFVPNVLQLKIANIYVGYFELQGIWTYWIYSRNIVFRRICAIFRPTDITFHQILLLKCTLLLYLASQQLIRETTVTSLSLCAVWRWRRVSRKRGWRKKRWRCILCCNKTLVVAGAGNRELKTVASSKVPSDVKDIGPRRWGRFIVPIGGYRLTKVNVYHQIPLLWSNIRLLV